MFGAVHNQMTIICWVTLLIYFPAISPQATSQVSNDILPLKNDTQTPTTALKQPINK